MIGLKKIIYSSFLLILVLFVATKSIEAADIKIADKTNGNINIEKGEQVKNLYSIGDVVSINSEIEKSIYTIGNVLNVNEPIKGDVNSISGTLIIKNNIGGTVHAVTKNLIIEGNITDDLFAIGTSILIDKQSSINGDAFLIGDINIQGPIKGNATLIGNTILINNEIFGDLKIKSANKIVLGSNAIIKGNFEYSSSNEIEMQNGSSVLGSVINNSEKELAKKASAKEKAGKFFALIVSITVLIKVIGLLILGLILIRLFKKFTEKSVEEVFSCFWKNLGIGFAFLVLTPIIAILLVATIVGLWPGIAIILIYIISMFVAVTLSAITLGNWLMKTIKKDNGYSIGLKELVLGIVFFVILGLIPVVGQLAVFILILLSLGATYKTIINLHK